MKTPVQKDLLHALGMCMISFRERNKMSQDQLAGRLGTTRPVIEKVETFKSFPPMPVFINFVFESGHSFDEALGLQDYRKNLLSKTFRMIKRHLPLTWKHIWNTANLIECEK